ncbi:MAG TPA: PP2C family protein-serine/threonine phosphatase [Tepidisphaeraceae bacterium]|jgi:serine phosphatase RsbU (regulator of sigma subunit)
MGDAELKQMHCMEVWGGNRCIDSGVIMPGLDAWLYSQPCQQQAEGGDVHYVSTCASGQVVRMLVADVSGHGPTVAQTAADLRALMRRYVNYHDQLRFVRSLNREFTSASADGIFATAVVMTFDAPTNRVLVSNAGHPPPLWWRARLREWTYLKPDAAVEGGDVPWGIIEGADYHQFGVRLRVGDLVLSYTDCLPEARDRRGELIGAEGLLERVRELGPPDAREFLPRLLDVIGREDESNLTRDDVTCLLIRPNGLRPRVPIRDLLLAPVRVVASWGGMRIGWTGAPKGLATRTAATVPESV